MSEINFSDVTWGRKKETLITRRVIYDEVSDDEPKNYRLIEETYRQLKKNYEARGSYGQAGDFHYGEMEMQRLAQKGIFRYFSLNFFYKLLSGYGEKQWLAFFWILVLTGLCASCYLLSGIEINGVDINYDLARSWPLFTKIFWSHFGEAVSYSIGVATFIRKPTEGTSIETIQRIMTPILGTLLILAIKRRFKR